MEVNLSVSIPKRIRWSPSAQSASMRNWSRSSFEPLVPMTPMNQQLGGGGPMIDWMIGQPATGPPTLPVYSATVPLADTP